MDRVFLDKKIEVSAREYNLLRAVYDQFKKQVALLRIFEAEENLQTGKTKTVSFRKFVENI
ncbi:MAG TPA: hypothetical protein VJC15_02955 [Candidatus Paceibacterota bacterium]